MNSDDMQGKVKEAAGKATDNERLESEGRTDQAKGKAKEAVDDAKDAVKGVRDSLTNDDAAERRVQPSRRRPARVPPADRTRLAGGGARSDDQVGRGRARRDAHADGAVDPALRVLGGVLGGLGGVAPGGSIDDERRRRRPAPGVTERGTSVTR